MQVSIVHVHVKPENINDFMEVTRKNHEASIQENGNRRFDVLQSTHDLSRFVLYEAYDSLDDAAAHKKTTHYLEWRETVEEWMASPRESVPYNVLYPA